MRAPAFQLNKVRRLIKEQGRSITVTRQSLNKFNEPNGEAEVFTITGVFHETTSYLSKNGSNGSTVRTKPSPMFLTLWESASPLHVDDKVTLNNKQYTIGEIKNMAEANLVADISLEEVQNSGK